MKTIEENIKKIESFLALEKGWNGYSAEPFEKSLVEKAISLLDKLPSQPDVFPTGRNSIQFEYHLKDKYVEIEIFKDTIKLFVTEDFSDEKLLLEKINRVVE